MFPTGLLWIALPISLQSVLQASLNIIDQLMVGQLGSGGMAAVGIGSQYSFIFLMLMQGLASGLSVFIAQATGADDRDGQIRALRVAWIVGTAALLFFVLPALSAPEFLIALFTTDVVLAQEARDYLLVTLGSFPSLVLIFLLSAQLRATGKQNVPLYTGVISVASNTVLNFCLIFGHFGLPQLEAVGAAWATVIARFIEAGLLLYATHRTGLPLGFKYHSGWFDKRLMARFATIVMPISVMNLLWVAFDTLLILIFGRVGADALAALMTSYPLQSFVFSLVAGFTAASAIVLGKDLGDGRHLQAQDKAIGVIRLLLVLSLVLMAIILIVLEPYLSLYRLQSNAAALAVQINLCFAFLLIIKIVNLGFEEGILRSGGDTHFTLYVGSVSAWLVAAPCGLAAAYYFDWPLYVVYLALSADEFVKIAFQWRRVRQGVWCRNLLQDT